MKLEHERKLKFQRWLRCHQRKEKCIDFKRIHVQTEYDIWMPQPYPLTLNVEIIHTSSKVDAFGKNLILQSSKNPEELGKGIQGKELFPNKISRNGLIKI